MTARYYTTQKSALLRRMRVLLLIVAILVSYLATPLAFGAEAVFDLPPEPTGPPADLVPGELIVKLKGDDTARVVSVAEGSEEHAARVLKVNMNVEYAEPNYVASALWTGAPNDPLYSEQWNMEGDAKGSIHVEEAWSKTKGFSATVAIVDSGVAYQDYTDYATGMSYKKAPDLKGVTMKAGWDFVNNDSYPNDDFGHGTHVAGTIAQKTNNRVGAVGIAPSAMIMPIKVLDQNGHGSYKDIADGIRYAADHGADIINVSLGGTEPSAYLEDAVAYARVKGATVIAATGNNGTNEVLYPAAYDKYVIAVGATRLDGSIAPYSNTGTAVDIVAPGGDLSQDMNKDGKPDGIVQQTFQGNVSAFAQYRFQGTSMAAAHVSGVAALVVASRRASTPDALAAVLYDSALDLGPKGKDRTYGHGLVQANAAVLGKTSASAPAPTPDPAPVPAPAPKPTPVPAPSPVPAPAPKPEPAPAGVANLDTRFNNGLGGWTPDRTVWWGHDTSDNAEGAGHVSVRGYANNSTFTSPTASLGNGTLEIVWSWKLDETVDKGEYIALDVSRDGGATWQEKARLKGDVDAEGVWTSSKVSVQASDRFMLRFRAKISTFNEYAHIDSVQVVKK